MAVIYSIAQRARSPPRRSSARIRPGPGATGIARTSPGAIGILGYLNDQPVAWCSIAPRETYRQGLGGLAASTDEPGSVWSLACFFVLRACRGQGIIHQLIQAAIEHARTHGARVIEAYPVDPDSPSYRFMGFVDTFRTIGFQHVGEAGSRRHVMRYHVR